jgi:hypothetical protein
MFGATQWSHAWGHAQPYVAVYILKGQKWRMMKTAASRRSVDFPRNSGQLLKNSAYHQNEQSERA